MAGVYETSEGDVFYHGKKWSELSVMGKHDLYAKVGMQFQKGALFDCLWRERLRLSPSCYFLTIPQQVLIP
jgi:ABC-type transporter Mla maintaining outer membrane lipid asymmetry ATPase subunit MlaF